MNAEVTGCTAKGKITATLEFNSSIPVFAEESAAGGIAGEMSGTVENCTAACIVSASNDSPKNYAANAGGIAGICTDGLTVRDCKAFATVRATRTGHAANDTWTKQGALVGTTEELALEGTNWAVKTSDIEAVDGVNMLDTTVLTDGTFGDTKQLCKSTLPYGITLTPDFAALDEDGTVTYTKAGSGTISLAYDGQVFYS